MALISAAHHGLQAASAGAVSIQKAYGDMRTSCVKVAVFKHCVQHML